MTGKKVQAKEAQQGSRGRSASWRDAWGDRGLRRQRHRTAGQGLGAGRGWRGRASHRIAVENETFGGGSSAPLWAKLSLWHAGSSPSSRRSASGRSEACCSRRPRDSCSPRCCTAGTHDWMTFTAIALGLAAAGAVTISWPSAPAGPATWSRTTTPCGSRSTSRRQAWRACQRLQPQRPPRTSATEASTIHPNDDRIRSIRSMLLPTSTPSITTAVAHTTISGTV